jgi:hypothetical protein
MRKTIVLLLGLVTAASLTACGSATVEGIEQAGEGLRLDEKYPDALPVVSQLLVGTINLESTDMAVDPEQAAELLPLWKAARSLYTSDTSAEAEKTAILNQIQDAMAPEQIEAIAAMQLTQEDVMGSMQEIREALGFEGWGMLEGFPEGELPEGFPGFGRGGQLPEGFAGAGQGRQSPGGQGMGQGIPGGEFGQGLDPEALATLQSSRGNRQGMQIPNPMLFESLIQFLEVRAQE